jgi:hypothetical protein
LQYGRILNNTETECKKFSFDYNLYNELKDICDFSNVKTSAEIEESNKILEQFYTIKDKEKILKEKIEKEIFW